MRSCPSPGVLTRSPGTMRSLPGTTRSSPDGSRSSSEAGGWIAPAAASRRQATGREEADEEHAEEVGSRVRGADGASGQEPAADGEPGRGRRPPPGRLPGLRASPFAGGFRGVRDASGVRPPAAPAAPCHGTSPARVQVSGLRREGVRRVPGRRRREGVRGDRGGAVRCLLRRGDRVPRGPAASGAEGEEARAEEATEGTRPRDPAPEAQGGGSPVHEEDGRALHERRGRTGLRMSRVRQKVSGCSGPSPGPRRTSSCGRSPRPRGSGIGTSRDARDAPRSAHPETRPGLNPAVRRRNPPVGMTGPPRCRCETGTGTPWPREDAACDRKGCPGSINVSGQAAFWPFSVVSRVGLQTLSTVLPRLHPQAAHAGLRFRRAAARPESLRAGRRTGCRTGGSAVRNP